MPWSTRRPITSTTVIGAATIGAVTAAVLHGAGLGRPSIGEVNIVLSARAPHARAAAVVPSASTLEPLHAMSRVVSDSSPAAVRSASERSAPMSFDSPTACIASFLPGISSTGDSLQFVCDETDLWSVERRAHVRIASQRGAGAQLWQQLGRYSLGAVAVLRHNCCPHAEPLRSVVPGLWCGILRDDLRALGAAPSEASVMTLRKRMDCLVSRGVKMPARWLRSPEDTSLSAFNHVVDAARLRSNVRDVPGETAELHPAR